MIRNIFDKVIVILEITVPIGVIVFFAVFLCLNVPSCNRSRVDLSNFNTGPREAVMEKNWGVSIPEGAELEYDLLHPVLWEGEFYSVYKCDEISSEYLSDFEIGISESYKQDIMNIIDVLEKRSGTLLPEEYAIDFEKETFIKKIRRINDDRDIMFMIYCPENNKLAVLERIM